MKVLVLATNDLFGHSVTAALGSAGCQVFLMGSAPWGMGRLSRHCRRYLRAKRADLVDGPKPFLKRLASQCRNFGIDVVVPADLPTSLMLTLRRDSIVPAIFPVSADADLLDRLHDKGRFAALAEELGLPHPRTRVLRRAGEVAALDLPYPLIAKPADGEGGIDVRRIDSPGELTRYLDDHGPRRSIVQTFIEGEDIDLSFLADHGKMVAWTIQQRVPSRPGVLRFLENDRVFDIGRRLVEATGYQGVAHLDMRIDRETGAPLILEVNPRFWGSLLYSVWAGVNFPLLGLQLALGRDPGKFRGPPLGECCHSGLSVRRMFQALLRGRFVPAGLSPANRRAWIFNHENPLPLIWERLAGSSIAPLLGIVKNPPRLDPPRKRERPMEAALK